MNTAIFHAQSFTFLLEALPDDARILALSKKNMNGITFVHRTILSTKALEVITQHIPHMERLATLKDSQGNTPLHWAIDNISSLKILLNSIHPKERLKVINQKNKIGETALHMTSNCEVISTIMLSIPAKKRIKAINAKNGAGVTILQQYINDHEMTKFILSFLTLRQRNSALTAENKEGKCFLDLSHEDFKMQDVIEEALNTGSIHRFSFFNVINENQKENISSNWFSFYSII